MVGELDLDGALADKHLFESGKRNVVLNVRRLLELRTRFAYLNWIDDLRVLKKINSNYPTLIGEGLTVVRGCN